MSAYEDTFIVEMNADILALTAELHGMIAENTQRQIEGYSPAYTEVDFANIVSSANYISQRALVVRRDHC